MRISRLPDFPWDSLAADKALAAAHPDGIVDLSVGTPVDPVPDVVRAALAGPAADVPGYPTTHGTPELREAIAGSLARRFGVTVDPFDVLPTIGSKELVAWLPTLLGVTAGDLVVIPEVAYPTYEVGALLAGAEFVRTDGLTALGPAPPGPDLAQLPVQPDGPGAAGRAPAQGRRLGAGAGHGRGVRRVLPVAVGPAAPAARRSCTRTSATATTPACSRCTR